MTANQAVTTLLPGLTQASNNKTSNVTKAIEFWGDFRAELKTYLTDLVDDDKETVTIDGKAYEKNSASALNAMEWWTYDIESTLDAILKNIKFETDIADKLNSLFA